MTTGDTPALDPVLTWQRDNNGHSRVILADFGYGVSVRDGVIHVHEALPTPSSARLIAAALLAAADWVESAEHG